MEVYTEPYIVLIELAIYAYFAFSLQKIAAKTDTKNGWFAWLPIFNLYLVCKIVKKPVWWILLLCIPVINIFFFLILSMELANACHKSSWIGALMLIPGVNLFIPGYLAFSKSDIPPDLLLQEEGKKMDIIIAQVKAGQNNDSVAAEAGTMAKIITQLEADQKKDGAPAESGTRAEIVSQPEADQKKDGAPAESGTMAEIASQPEADQKKDGAPAESGTRAEIVSQPEADQKKDGAPAESGTRAEIASQPEADQTKDSAPAESRTMAEIVSQLEADQRENGLEKTEEESSDIFSYIVVIIAVIFGFILIYLFLKWQSYP